MNRYRFKCVVRGCRMKEIHVDNDNKTWGRKLQVSLHVNPKDPVLSNRWKKILLAWNNSRLPNSTFHVCSAHFKRENVIVQFGQTKLAPNSIPTIQDSTYLLPNDVQKKGIKLEFSEQYENVEYLEVDESTEKLIAAIVGEASNYETDPLILNTIKEELESDDQDTTEENRYKNDEAIESTRFEQHMEIDENFIEPVYENHEENQCQAKFSKTNEEKLRVENVPQRTTESCDYHKDKKNVRYNRGVLTNFYDCKVKVRKLDRIVKVLRVRNSRQINRIMSLQKTLAELRKDLKKSNQALALLLKPDFEFQDS